MFLLKITLQTTPSFMFNLYCLAKHPEVQERIYEEISRIIPPGKVITVSMMNQLQLLKASVKETFR
jgi:cytochrome P450